MSEPVFYGPYPFVDRAYRGDREGGNGARVCVIDRAANVTRRLKHLVYHSPTGFEWGYQGSGPADLARSILADFVGFDPAPALYQAFKARVVAELEEDGWTLEAAQIRTALRAIAGELGVGCLRCFDQGTISATRRALAVCPTCGGRSAEERLAARVRATLEEDPNDGDEETSF